MATSKPIRVLHVDDEPDFADLAAEFLERVDDNIAVETATSASEGLDRLDEHDYDCIVSDFDMPGLDGIEFLEIVREEYPGLPFILFTGKGSEDIASEAITAGASDYLQKGSGSERYELLANRIRNAVERLRSTHRLTDLERIRRLVRDANQAMVRARTRKEIEREICELIADSEPYRFAWIGELDADSQTVTPSSAAGVDEGYLDAITITTDESTTGQGPTGRAVRTQELAVAQDIQANPEYEPWRDAALDRGYEASAAVPIVQHDTVSGVLNVYAGRSHAFDADERELLQELAGDLANAFTRIEAVGQLRRFRAAVEASGHSIYFTDSEGTIEYVNPAFEAITGYTAEEAVGQNPRILQSGEHDQAFYEELWETILAGDVWRSEVINTTKSGDRYVVDQTIAPVRAEDDTIEHVVAVNSEITERKERELELERYETMLNRAGDIVYATDPDGYLTTVNDEATAFLGYASEELVGAHVSLVMDDTDVATGEALIQELLADEDRDEGVFEMNLVTSDGERIPCEDHIHLLVTDGEFRGAVGVVRDITEWKEYENTLEALHETTRDLFQCETREEVAQQTAAAAKSVLGYPTNVVRLCSADGTSLQPVAVTENAKAVYGKRPTYAVGEGPVGDVYASGRTRVCEDVQQLDDGHDRGEARAGLYVPLGEFGTLSINSTAVDAFDQSDVRLAELLATSVEAALERIERTQELRRQNEQLEKFASVLSHDLRNPLNVAQGRLDLAQRECDSEHLADVAQAHDRMETLIEDVLTLTREGRSVGETTTVSVATVAEAAWTNVETDETTVEINENREIEADESRLRQLFENLFRNAVEHAGDACTVSVGTLDDPPGFYVADDGPGIPPDERDDVFESGYSTASEGTGFGLSIVKQIAEAHGWEVGVTSSDRDGARFEIRDTTQSDPQDD